MKLLSVKTSVHVIVLLCFFALFVPANAEAISVTSYVVSPANTLQPTVVSGYYNYNLDLYGCGAACGLNALIGIEIDGVMVPITPIFNGVDGDWGDNQGIYCGSPPGWMCLGYNYPNPRVEQGPYSLSIGPLSAGVHELQLFVMQFSAFYFFVKAYSPYQFTVVSASAPTVETRPPQDITNNSATLYGAVTANGLSSTGWFRYGQSNTGDCSTLSSRTNTWQDAWFSASAANQLFGAGIGGLSPGSTWYYCAVGQNSIGTSYGAINTLSIPLTTPNRPSKPEIYGPDFGNLNTSYTFSFVSVDPENDWLRYSVDWGDGTYSDWIPDPFSGFPYANSGQTVSASHSYANIGSYFIRVMATDMWGYQSEWGEHMFFLWPMNGMCGIAAYSTYFSSPPPTSDMCMYGDPSPVPAASVGFEWRWTCNGWNGGTNQSCMAFNPSPPPPSGSFMPRPTNCTINLGASWCNTSFGWSVNNSSSPQVRRNGATIYTGAIGVGSGNVSGDGTTFTLHDGSMLDSQSVIGICAIGSVWNSGTGTCVLPAPAGSVSAFPTVCTIPVGSNLCNVPFTWNITNASSPNLFNETRNTQYTTNTSGSGVLYPITNGANTVSVRNGSTVLASVSVSGSCASGSTWNGNLCLANATINSFSVLPASVPYNTPSVLSWVTTGATSVTIDQGIGSVALSGTTGTGDRTVNTTFTLTAANGVGPNATQQVTLNILTGCLYGIDVGGRSIESLNVDRSPLAHDSRYRVVMPTAINPLTGTRDFCFGNSGGPTYLVPLRTETEFMSFWDAIPGLQGIYKIP